MADRFSSIFNWGNLSKYRNIIYGFSAIWIIVLHIFGYFPNITQEFHPAIIHFFQTGSVGVDIFLIMSGVCLYFSLKKTNGTNILNFYKKRFSKIFKIYFLVCIPWLIFWTIYNNRDFSYFINQATIIGYKGGQFWFIHFIAICYLIYPLIYRLIEKNKSYFIIAFIPVYFAFLCFLSITFESFYQSYEIALVRLIPFLIGCLLAKRVYEKKAIKQTTVLSSLSLLLIRDSVFTFLNIKNITLLYQVCNRTYYTILAISTILLIIIFFELFSCPKSKKLLESVGKISLESYIIHIILLKTTLDILHIIPESITQLLFFTLLFIPIALLISQLTQQILNYIPPKNHKSPLPPQPPF